MSDETAPACTRCGGAGHHTWTEGDCVLPHNYHSHRHPPKADHGHICRHCVQKHRDWLGEIVDLYAQLIVVLLPGSVPDTTADHKRPKKAPEAPAPVRLEVLAMMSDRSRLMRTGADTDLPDVPTVLTDMAQRYCDDHDLAGASLNGTVSTAAHLLAEHAETLAHDPWIDDYDAELGWVRGHLRRAHGISSSKPSPVGRCPSLTGDGAMCGGPLWPVNEGEMAVECGTCHRHFDERFLRHLGGMIAS